jgi:hypothetical protein
MRAKRRFPDAYCQLPTADFRFIHRVAVSPCDNYKKINLSRLKNMGAQWSSKQ